MRTFYQHFAGKDELLLALYEDVTAQFTEAIRERVEAADGPMAQLEAWCKGVLSRPGSSHEVGGRLVLIYNLSLEMDHPEAFAKVWEPHRKLLTEILTACSQAGQIRTDLTLEQLTSLLGYTLTSLGQFNALHEGMDGTRLTEEVVWSLLVSPRNVSHRGQRAETIHPPSVQPEVSSAPRLDVKA